MNEFFKKVCIQSVTCRKCGKTIEFPTFEKDWERFERGEENTLPYISPAYRELLISGICPECQE